MIIQQNNNFTTELHWNCKQ